MITFFPNPFFIKKYMSTVSSTQLRSPVPTTAPADHSGKEPKGHRTTDFKPSRSSPAFY